MSGGDMSDIVITGIGQVPVREHWDAFIRVSWLRRPSWLPSKTPAVKNRRPCTSAMFWDRHSHARPTWARCLTSDCGLEGTEGTTIEAAGAIRRGSPAYGLPGARVRARWTAPWWSGSKRSRIWWVRVLIQAIAETLDTDYEGMLGVTPTALAALLMRRYMHEYKLDHNAFADHPLAASAHAVGNPNAMYRKAISREAYEKDAPVCDPLSLHDIASYADGAAALLLTRRELVGKDFQHPVVRISGSAVVTDRLSLHDRPDPLAFEAAGAAINRACRQAGILPGDVDILELDDAFSIYPVLSVEAAGYAPRGKGTGWLKERPARANRCWPAWVA